MQDLIKRMAEVANEMDEIGLTEQASGVDLIARQLTSQIGGYAPGGIGGGIGDGLEDEETGIDEEMQALDEETAARVQEKKRLLEERKNQQRQQVARPATMPAA